MSAATIQTGTIETAIPSRLDRLPWSKFHWRVIVGLGTAWILDGLEVTMVGAIAARLTKHGSGISMTPGDIGTAAAIYVVGACLGALFFGQLCDGFGRKRLFIITLGIYVTATVVTAFSFAPWFFFLARFFTGAGIGGEYSAVNSAIDELIPARVRGRVDLIINGSYWLGSAAGSAAAIFFLSDIFPKNIGWRVAFVVGAVLGVAVMLVRRNVPESPRWLFIHGREDEAERIVGNIESEVTEETDQALSDVDDTIEVRQRKTVQFRQIARVAVKMYPKRSILCIALFVGQAFLYNGITFNLGTLMSTFFGVSAATVPLFLILYAASNFVGPVVLGRLFDTVGRVPMIAGTYLGSTVLGLVLAWLFAAGVLNSGTFIIMVMAVFFLASSGASAAYLTASEIFPMETRALAIAFFYAIGTAVGGIAGPLLFGNLIGTDDTSMVALAFVIGSVVMALGGVMEIFFGIKAEGEQLEDIAKPLTVADAEGSTGHGARRDVAEPADTSGSRDEPASFPPSSTRTSEADDGAAARAAAATRARERVQRRTDRERRGLRRYRPGPGRFSGSPGIAVSSPLPPQAFDHEIAAVQRAVADHGITGRQELFDLVGARYWGPGVFREVLREAVAEGEIQRTSRTTFGPADGPGVDPGRRSDPPSAGPQR